MTWLLIITAVLAGAWWVHCRSYWRGFDAGTRYGLHIGQTPEAKPVRVVVQRQREVYELN